MLIYTGMGPRLPRIVQTAGFVQGQIPKHTNHGSHRDSNGDVGDCLVSDTTCI